MDVATAGSVRRLSRRSSGWSPAVFAAAPHFEHRLPEVFAGYPAPLTTVPVAFPTASRPQAWAGGAPRLLLTTLLDLEPGRADVRVSAAR